MKRECKKRLRSDLLGWGKKRPTRRDKRPFCEKKKAKKEDGWVARLKS